MNRKYFFPLVVLSGLMTVPFLSVTAHAETRVVQNTACSTGTTTCYTNLQTAIDAATAGDTIEIKPGTYTGNFLVNKNISIYGTETAATFLSGRGTGVALTVSSVTGAMAIRRLTFVNSTTGLLVQNSPSVTVSNSVFVGATVAGVESAGSTGTYIINNVFYNNTTAVYSDTQDISIINNIFSHNETAIGSNVALALAGIKNNLFFSNNVVGPSIEFTTTASGYLGNKQSVDPKFVHPEDTDFKNLDFHLKAGTPAENAGHTDGGIDTIDGTDPDMGAYGGSTSDTIPVTSELSSSVTGTIVTVSWTPNLAYQVGGYKFYSGTASGVYGTPVDVGLVTSYTFTASSLASAPTGTPVLNNEFVSQTLLLSWGTSTVTGATGYEIHYTLQSAATTTVIDAGNTTFYPLAGLVNATSDSPLPYYDVYVIPYAQNVLYMAVKSYYSGSKESSFSNEENISFGGKLYGIQSNTITDYPEVIYSLQNLPDSGCFIATAAYGYYSAPHVQVLREFRDRYLLTNKAGKAFVDWYYRKSPAAAMVINSHPWMKPAVRVALLPAVGTSLFLLHTPFPLKVAAGLAFMAIFVFLIVRKRISLPQGGGR